MLIGGRVAVVTGRGMGIGESMLTPGSLPMESGLLTAVMQGEPKLTNKLAATLFK